MSKPTFGNILATYMAFCSVLALLIPTHAVLENYIPIDPNVVPVAGWLRNTPHALPYLTSYFSALTALLPFVLIAQAYYPQPKEAFHYNIPTLGQCVISTFLAICIFFLFAAVAYGDLSVDSNINTRGEAFFYIAATSRLGLAICGPLFMGASAIALHITFVKLPRMWLGLRTGRFG